MVNTIQNDYVMQANEFSERNGIEIKTGNAAFHDCDAENEHADYYATAAELDRIFGQISRAVAEGRTDGKVIDSNGNICGEWRI